MKIRVPASKLFIDTLNAMGASAVPNLIGEFLTNFTDNKYIFLLIVNAILLFVGMFI